jgi:hypothetical protein
MRSAIPTLTLILASLTVTGAEVAPLVAPLKNQDAIDGCSWSASSDSLGKGYIFLSEFDDSKTLMNIAGSDIELKLVRENGQLKKLGDVLDRTFQAGDVTVKAHYVVTWACPKGDESCEVTRFSITFEVSKGGKTQTVKATGDVGC